NKQLANYHEALRWYGDYLKSFPTAAESPAINYRLADLLFENKDFGEAAKQYERTAYGYPTHSQSAAAGYAAVYAYRQQLKDAGKEQQEAVKRATIASALKLADIFPDHAEAAAVLGAAADDLYEMKNYRPAIASAQRVIDKYPGAEAAIRRSAWIVVAHGSFELAEYPQAEHAYAQVLTVTPEGDAARAGFVETLGASIYKQGEIARKAAKCRALRTNTTASRPCPRTRPCAARRCSPPEISTSSPTPGIARWTCTDGTSRSFPGRSRRLSRRASRSPRSTRRRTRSPCIARSFTTSCASTRPPGRKGPPGPGRLPRARRWSWRSSSTGNTSP